LWAIKEILKSKFLSTDYQKAEGRFEYKDLQDDKIYFCPEHQREHECLDVYKYWFSDKVDVSYNPNLKSY
jgi:hypothetical protein